MKDAFRGYHPIVNFTWFALVLIFSMVFMHPCLLAISLACAVGYAAYLTGGKSAGKSLRYLLPLVVLTAALGPVFNHEGATILRWLPNGNPLTLESIYFGIAAAIMLVAVIEWFICFNRIVTSDKFTFLFGRIIPALSLLLSMTMRFVPRFMGQLKAVSNAQKSLGRDKGGGNIFTRARRGLTSLSITVTWALENAIETADSMKSRGYGLSGRTAFSIYHFDRRDLYTLIFTVLCAAYVVIGGMTGGIFWQYYPVVYGELTSPYTISVFIIYLAMCAMPLLLSLWEDHRWKSSQSAI